MENILGIGIEIEFQNQNQDTQKWCMKIARLIESGLERRKKCVYKHMGSAKRLERNGKENGMWKAEEATLGLTSESQNKYVPFWLCCLALPPIKAVWPPALHISSRHVCSLTQLLYFGRAFVCFICVGIRLCSVHYIRWCTINLTASCFSVCKYCASTIHMCGGFSYSRLLHSTTISVSYINQIAHDV